MKTKLSNSEFMVIIVLNSVHFILEHSLCIAHSVRNIFRNIHEISWRWREWLEQSSVELGLERHVHQRQCDVKKLWMHKRNAINERSKLRCSMLTQTILRQARYSQETSFQRTNSVSEIQILNGSNSLAFSSSDRKPDRRTSEVEIIENSKGETTQRNRKKWNIIEKKIFHLTCCEAFHCIEIPPSEC